MGLPTPSKNLIAAREIACRRGGHGGISPRWPFDFAYRCLYSWPSALEDPLVSSLQKSRIDWGVFAARESGGTGWLGAAISRGRPPRLRLFESSPSLLTPKFARLILRTSCSFTSSSYIFQRLYSEAICVVGVLCWVLIASLQCAFLFFDVETRAFIAFTRKL